MQHIRCHCKSLDTFALLLQELRAPLIALRAFNVELTQIPDNVKQEQLMQIRMQWWRDAVKSAYTDKPQPNPVIQALHAVRITKFLNIAEGLLWGMTAALVERLWAGTSHLSRILRPIPRKWDICVGLFFDCDALTHILCSHLCLSPPLQCIRPIPMCTGPVTYIGSPSLPDLGSMRT